MMFKIISYSTYYNVWRKSSIDQVSYRLVGPYKMVVLIYIASSAFFSYNYNVLGRKKGVKYDFWEPIIYIYI